MSPVGPARSCRRRRFAGQRRHRLRLDRGLVVGADRRHHRAAAVPSRRRSSTGADPLAREARLGLEAILVEDLGGEVAQVRMEAPGVLEEEAQRRRHRRRVAEDVRKGRRGRPPADAYPGAAGRAVAGRRGGRGCRVARADRDRRWRARSGRPRPRTGRRRLASSRRRPEPEVPAARLARPSSRRAGRRIASLPRVTPRVVEDLRPRRPSGPAATVDSSTSPRPRTRQSAGCRSPCGSSPVIPTRLPAASSEQIIRAAGERLARSRGVPGSRASCGRARARADVPHPGPSRRADGASSSSHWPTRGGQPEEQVASRAGRPGRLDPVVRRPSPRARRGPPGGRVVRT